MGTMRDATAAAEPPLEPPGVQLRFHGFLVAPNASGSVVGRSPNSHVFVLPTVIKPALLYLRTNSLSWSGTYCFNIFEPMDMGTPLYDARRSLSRKGTPVKEPSG